MQESCKTCSKILQVLVRYCQYSYTTLSRILTRIFYFHARSYIRSCMKFPVGMHLLESFASDFAPQWCRNSGKRSIDYCWQKMSFDDQKVSETYALCCHVLQYSEYWFLTGRYLGSTLECCLYLLYFMAWWIADTFPLHSKEEEMTHYMPALHDLSQSHHFPPLIVQE